MSVSAIFVLDVKGRILIYRDYRGDVSTKFAEKFMSKVNESEDSGKLSPVLHDEGVTYIYLQHSNVYLLAVTRQNVNATAVMVFLHRLVEMFKYYFEAVEEESIRDNFVTVYELLDEVRARVGGGSASRDHALMLGSGMQHTLRRVERLTLQRLGASLQQGARGHSGAQRIMH